MPDHSISDAELTLPAAVEAKMQALLADQRQRRHTEDEDRLARRRLWLTHHWADEYDRCAMIGTHRLCRRCLALYPLALTVMVLALAGFAPWPGGLEPWIIWVLCIPATIDFLAEKLLDTPYDRVRQVVVTMLVAPALGRGLATEIESRWSFTFWGPVVVFGTIWFIAAVTKAQRVMFARALEASLARSQASDLDTTDLR